MKKLDEKVRGTEEKEEEETEEGKFVVFTYHMLIHVCEIKAPQSAIHVGCKVDTPHVYPYVKPVYYVRNVLNSCR